MIAALRSLRHLDATDFWHFVASALIVIGVLVYADLFMEALRSF